MLIIITNSIMNSIRNLYFKVIKQAISTFVLVVQ